MYFFVFDTTPCYNISFAFTLYLPFRILVECALLEIMEESMHDLEENVKRVDIDPDGDLILVLEATELKVSSKALSLASKVFKAMFKPGFKDGNTMRAGKGSLFSIHLPDDDTDAMSTICKIIHYKPDPISEVSIDTVKDVAIAADKYDCIQSISLWFATCMSHFREADAAELAQKLLFPAFIFDDPVAFQDITKTTVYSLKGFKNPRSLFSRKVTYGVDPEIRTLLPKNLLGKSSHEIDVVYS